MRRDMDLIRDLMLKLEGLVLHPGAIVHFKADDDDIQMPGYTSDEIQYHLRLLVEASFIEPGKGTMQGFMFRSITWAGHDFVDSVRSPEVWAKTKKGAEAAGGFTVDLLKDLAKGFVKKQIEELTGVKL